MSDTKQELDADMISKSLDMEVVRYSKVWEDSRVLAEGLDINKDDVMLCITSSGDNVLNFLLQEPKEIYAVDLSVAQSALLELKIAAIKGLNDYHDYLQLLGEHESSKRTQLFHQVQEFMPKYASDYWSKNIEVIENGLVWCGRLEQYILEYATVHYPKVVDIVKWDEVFGAKDLEEQRKVLDTFLMEEFQGVFRLFANKEAQAKGRSNQQLKYVDQSSDEVGRNFWEKFLDMCNSQHLQDNFYCSWCVRGNHGYDPATNPEFAPPYLTEKGFHSLKRLVGRVTVCTGSLHELLQSLKSKNITKLSLSNIFEYLSEQSSDAMFEILSATLSPGAVIAYFELLAPRTPPPANTKLKYLKDLCDRLSPKGRVFWFRNRLRLYEVQ